MSIFTIRRLRFGILCILQCTRQTAKNGLASCCSSLMQAVLLLLRKHSLCWAACGLCHFHDKPIRKTEWTVKWFMWRTSVAAYILDEIIFVILKSHTDMVLTIWYNHRTLTWPTAVSGCWGMVPKRMIEPWGSYSPSSQNGQTLCCLHIEVIDTLSK